MTIMTERFSIACGRRSGSRGALFALSALALLLAAAGPARAQNAIVIVNGDPITAFDVDQRMKLNALSGGKGVNRQDVIEELINDRVKIREAKKFNVDLTPGEVDAQYSMMGARMRLSTEQLTKMLEGRGIRPDTLKSRLKADYVWSQIIRGRYGQNLMVGEKDIASAIQVKGDGRENSDSFEYKMRPVLLMMPRGSSQGTLEARRKEAETLRGRIRSCEQAERYFRSLRNGVVKGLVVKTSADIPAPLRTVLDNTPVGHLTPPEVTRQGVEMVALCSRAPTTDTPEKREAREKLFSQKYEAQSKKYLQEVRRASMIEYRK